MSVKKEWNLNGLELVSVFPESEIQPINQLNTKVNTEFLVGSLIRIPLSKIHKDINNARKTIDSQELSELANSMRSINPATGRARGNKNPVSLRPHPNIPGEYILNAGERRCAAAKLANLPDVLAFIDKEADAFDNAVDNIQRVALSAIEIAMFIQLRIEKGDKKKNIAIRLGKPASFVSDHLIFFDMADCIRYMYDSGQIASMQAMALLHRVYKKHPKEVEIFCTSVQNELTTADVRAFCYSLKELETPESLDDNKGKEELLNDTCELMEGDENEKSNKLKKSIIKIQYDSHSARLLTNRRAAYGFGWIKYDDSGREDEVDLSAVNIISIIEG